MAPEAMRMSFFKTQAKHSEVYFYVYLGLRLLHIYVYFYF